MFEIIISNKIKEELIELQKQKKDIEEKIEVLTDLLRRD